MHAVAYELYAVVCELYVVAYELYAVACQLYAVAHELYAVLSLEAHALVDTPTSV